MRSVVKPTLQLMSGRTFALAATFLIPFILVRTFDKTGFGLYKQVFLVYSTVFAIAQFGFAESLYYFVPNHPKDGGKLVVNALIGLSVMGLLCASVLTWGSNVIARWIHIREVAPYLPLLGIYIALTLVGATFEIALIARGRFKTAATSFAVSELMRSLMFVVPVLITGKLVWLLIGGVAFGVLRLTAVIVFLVREFPGQLRPDLGLFRTQFAYILPFQLAVLVETLQLNFHQYAVSYHFDAATFAIYATGCLQLPASDLLISPATNVMMVHMSEELREGRPASALGVWNDTTRKLMLMLIPLTGVLVACSRDLIVFLYTKAYLASVPIFVLWSLAMVLQAFPTDSVLRVHADTRAILFLNVVRLVFVVSTISLALGRFGLLGPVLVTLGSALLAKSLALGRIAKLMSVKPGDLVDWKVAGLASSAAMVSYIVTLAVRNRFVVAPIIGLGISGSVYATCCAALFGGWWLLKVRTLKPCVELPE